MNDRRKNWREYHPPMIPIYFIDIEALKDLLDRPEVPIALESLEQMMGYFEEFEQYEKAAVIRDHMFKNQMFIDNSLEDIMLEEEISSTQKTPNFPPPDDGQTWIPSEDGERWMRKATEDDIKKMIDSNFGKNDNTKSKRNGDTLPPQIGYNPFR